MARIETMDRNGFTAQLRRDGEMARCRPELAEIPRHALPRAARSER